MCDEMFQWQKYLVAIDEIVDESWNVEWQCNLVITSSSHIDPCGAEAGMFQEN